MLQEQLAKCVQDIAGVQSSFDADRQTLSRKFIYDTEHAKDLAIMCPVLDEVIGPDMAFVGGPQTDT
ncbi:MAG: hypothetical protein Hens3KO_11060 [Henriciella sp.]